MKAADNKPSQLWGHCYLGNKNAICKRKSNGPLEFGNHRPQSSSDLFANTAESYSSLTYSRKRYPSAKLLLILKNTQPSETRLNGARKTKGQYAGKWGTDCSLSNFKACACFQFPRETQHQHKIMQCWEIQVIRSAPHHQRGDNCSSEELDNLSKITQQMTVSTVKINKLGRDLVILIRRFS